MFHHKQMGEEPSPRHVVDAFHASDMRLKVARLIEDACAQPSGANVASTLAVTPPVSAGVVENQSGSGLLQERLSQILAENRLRVVSGLSSCLFGFAVLIAN
jgi:hypothetical protein